MALSKIVMTSSALVLGLTGIIGLFVPAELLTYFDLESSLSNPQIIQWLGALYLGYAMLNWMSKSSLLGGIYGRPIVIANFTHFFITATILLKGITSESGLNYWLLSIVITGFALGYAKILFLTPKLKS